jgi:hypothetical protein
VHAELELRPTVGSGVKNFWSYSDAVGGDYGVETGETYSPNYLGQIVANGGFAAGQFYGTNVTRKPTRDSLDLPKAQFNAADVGRLAEGTPRVAAAR